MAIEIGGGRNTGGDDAYERAVASAPDDQTVSVETAKERRINKLYPPQILDGEGDSEGQKALRLKTSGQRGASIKFRGGLAANIRRASLGVGQGELGWSGAATAKAQDESSGDRIKLGEYSRGIKDFLSGFDIETDIILSATSSANRYSLELFVKTGKDLEFDGRFEGGIEAIKKKLAGYMRTKKYPLKQSK